MPWKIHLLSNMNILDRIPSQVAGCVFFFCEASVAQLSLIQTFQRKKTDLIQQSFRAAITHKRWWSAVPKGWTASMIVNRKKSCSRAMSEINISIYTYIVFHPSRSLRMLYPLGEGFRTSRLNVRLEIVENFPGSKKKLPVSQKMALHKSHHSRRKYQCSIFFSYSCCSQSKN